MNCFVVKVCLLGDSSVGKSSIALRFVQDLYTQNKLPTIGSAFLSRYITTEQGGLYKLQIWDTAGQERYKSLVPLYYNGAAVILIVYDVTNRESLVKGAMEWVRQLRKGGPSNALYALVGNKVDLAENLREVDEAEARQVAEKMGAMFYETSAKSGENVTDLFQKVCSRLEKNKSLTPCTPPSGRLDIASPNSPQSENAFCLPFWGKNEQILSTKSLKLRLYEDETKPTNCCTG